MSIRTPGHYWVQDFDGRWTVAAWTGGAFKWQVIGSDDSFSDAEFKTIGPQAVGPPWGGTGRNDCIDCSACRFGEDANNARCAMVPDNIDFAWSAGKIPFGRWISEVDFFKPCRGWQGPCTIGDLRERAKAIAAYRRRIEEGYHDWKGAATTYVDRAAEALASAETKEAQLGKVGIPTSE